MIWSTYQGARSEVAFGTYREIAERSRSFDATAIFEPWQPAITGGNQPERLEGQSVSASFFRVLGVFPVLGRDFLASEDVVNGPKVVILSDKIWRRRFHGDSAILGRMIKLDDDNCTVIGVMASDFEDVVAPSAEIWTPVQYDPRQITSSFNSWEWGNHLHMMGRIKPEVSRLQAVQELAQIARTPWPQFPRPRWASLQHGLIVDSLQDDIARMVKPALLAVLGAVILVLAIAWVNVVNLVLARGSQRRGEFAVRGALGASKRRIIRQLITENLLLASLGGMAGMAVALAGLRALVDHAQHGVFRNCFAEDREEVASFDPGRFLTGNGARRKSQSRTRPFQALDAALADEQGRFMAGIDVLQLAPCGIDSRVEPGRSPEGGPRSSGPGPRGAAPHAEPRR